VKIILENKLKKLKKLRKLVKSEMKNYNQHKMYDDTFYDLEEWLNEIEGNIAKNKNKLISH